jgi:alkylhydroperoxidase family enzyme
MIYPDKDVARAVGEDPQTAPIPDLHKAMFRFAELFVKRSWQATPDDLQELRDNGADDREIADWLQIASTQTWFTSSADAGGIPLEANAVTGPVLARERSFYHGQSATEPVISESRCDHSALGWLLAPCSGENYQAAERWALDRYGFVPNLFKSVSACPDFYPRHQLALELLERPQSKSIPASVHALVRATVIALNRSAYFESTAQALLRRETEGAPDLDSLRSLPDGNLLDQQSQVVLHFVHKLVKSAYKITSSDAQAFRDSGMSDEAYVEVFNTAAIQLSLDRMANCLGVAADSRPLIDTQPG